MSFISTRGTSPVISYSELIMSGTAPDGGLYVPEADEQVNEQFLRSLEGKSYAEVANAVQSLLIGDFGYQSLARVNLDAYSARNFGHVQEGQYPSQIVQMVNLYDGLFLAQLYCGPTLAFKDYAMQQIARKVAQVLQGRRYTILLGTSGDTGSAAIEAFRPYPNVNMFVMAGGAGMSDFQRWQMFGTQESQVHCMLFPDFDQTQRLLKDVFSDRAFVDEVNLGAVNSVNFVRIWAQTVYAFWTYLKVAEKFDEKVDYVVPSGNFGDAFSVYLAKLMGLPVGKIVIATNQNDVLHRVIQEGVYCEAGKVQPSLSPSMDIRGASNFERALYYALNRNAVRIAQLYQELKDTGGFTLHEGEWNMLRRAGFTSQVCSEEECLRAITTTHRQHGLFIDPHTAVGIYAAEQERGANKCIVYGTASPAKFSDTVFRATGQRPPIPKAFAGLSEAPQRFDTIDWPMTPDQLKNYIRERI